MIRLSARSVLLYCLLAMVAVDALIVAGHPVANLRMTFVSAFLLVIPGFLLILAMKWKPVALEVAIYSIGLSVASLLFFGLLVNTALPLSGVPRPLDLTRTLPLLNVLVLVFSVMAYARNSTGYLSLSLPLVRNADGAVLYLALLLPFGSALGAVIQDRGGTNLVSAITLILVPCVWLGALRIRGESRDWIRPASLFLTGLALLFSFSLRSQHLIGWDVHEEFMVFSLTKEAGLWSMSDFQGSSYNACLSITILPTLLANLTGIPDEYVFKFLYQVLFAVTPVAVYMLCRVVTNTRLAFICSLLFLSQTWFMLQMPELARQEVALLFFVLTLTAIFSKTVHGRRRHALMLVFSLSIVLSHYSTAYIWMAVTASYFAIWAVTRLVAGSRQVAGPVIPLAIPLTTLISLVVWNIFITQSTANVTELVKDLSNNLSAPSVGDVVESGFARLTFKALDINTEANLQKAYAEASAQYAHDVGISQLYPTDAYRDWLPVVAPAELASPIVGGFAARAYRLIAAVVKLSVTDLFPIIGFCYFAGMLLWKRKRAHHYMLLALGAMPILAAILFFPLLKLNYNIERTYLQTLVLLAWPTVLGSFVVLTAARQKSGALLALVLILYVNNSGLGYQVFGGPAYLNLSNFGDAYNKYYTWDSEVRSAEWLMNERNPRDTIYADKVANLRLLAYGKYHSALVDLFPSTIQRNAYVYLDATNTQIGESYVTYNIDFVTFQLPIQFLSKNKDLIYSNGRSEVFR